MAAGGQIQHPINYQLLTRFSVRDIQARAQIKFKPHGVLRGSKKPPLPRDTTHLSPFRPTFRVPKHSVSLRLVDKMTKIFRIVGLTGSLRKESYNTKLLHAFATAARDPEFSERGVQFEIADWSKYRRLRTKANSRLPVFNEDLEPDVPKEVLEFKNKIAAADGFVIVTPEYNYS
jgi:NADPH-dependent FMN reductase